jgi:hypothetical protein
MKKSNCVICNADIDTRYYEIRGNFCTECSARAQMVANKMLSRKQADELLKERIREFCTDCKNNRGVCGIHI